MSNDIECLVIGAGVVGLAIARRMALAGKSTLVLEANEGIGMEVSARNSEVIHAGLYYPKDSLKAKFCVDGKHQLYAYCQEKGIQHQRLGKLLVATDAAQIQQFEQIKKAALANGVNDLEDLDQQQAQALEPNLHCVAALHSPSTGIVDTHGLMLALQGDAEHHDAQFVFRSPLLGLRVTPSGFVCQVGGDEATEISSDIVINAAGLHAPSLAHQFIGLDAQFIPQDYYCRGTYFSLSGKTPFQRLIYPMPSASGLGVHLTLDLGGQAKFGPDTEWIDGIDYALDESRITSFYRAVREYWPDLKDGSLQPAYTGIRPKIVGPHEPAADFMISGPQTHGIKNLVNLFGIESPGLTSCLAIADYVEQLLNPSA